MTENLELPDINELPELSGDIEDFIDDFSKKFHLINIEDFWCDSTNDKLKKFKTIVKKFYLNVQGNKCIYCRQKINVRHLAAWDLEHIVPKVRKPKWALYCNNLCVICKDCNTEKSDKKVLKNENLVNLPNKPDHYLIYNPHVDKYTKHITIVSPGELYIPETIKGRRTFDVCGFSRFLENLVGVGAKTNGNALLMMKICEMLMVEKDPKRIEKLNNLILVLARSNEVIIQQAKEGQIEDLLKTLAY